MPSKPKPKFAVFGGTPPRASQRHRRVAMPDAAFNFLAPFGNGDRVRWGNGRHEGVVAVLLEDGRVECVAAFDGRRWRLPLGELRRA